MFEMVQQPALHVSANFLHVELDLRNQRQVDNPTCMCRMADDEARVGSKKLHDTYAWIGAGLSVYLHDEFPGLFNRRQKAE